MAFNFIDNCHKGTKKFRVVRSDMRVFLKLIPIFMQFSVLTTNFLRALNYKL